MTLEPVAVVAIVGAIAAGAVLVIKALSDKQIAALRVLTESTAAVAKTATSIEGTAKVIEGHVNSAATRNAAIIAAQETQLAMLREALAKAENTALLLAQTKAVKMADSVTGATLIAHDAWEKDEREKTAASIAENTELTREIRDAVVPPKVEP